MDVERLLVDRKVPYLGPAQLERLLDGAPHAEVPAGQIAVARDPSEVEDRELVGEHLPWRNAGGELGRDVAPLPGEDHARRIGRERMVVKLPSVD